MVNLHSYLYINQRIVDDFISEIDGSIYDEEIVKSKQATSKDSTIEGGLYESGLGGRLSQDQNILSEKRLSYTYAAKVKKIHDFLLKNESLLIIDELDKECFDSLNRGVFFEVVVNARSSKLQQLVSSISMFSDIFSTMENLIQTSEEDRAIMKQIQDLRNMKETIDNGIYQLVLNPDGYADVSLIAQIEKNFLLDSIEKINKQCYILCKLQRKIKENEEIEVDAILESVNGLMPFVNEQQNIANPPEIKDIVKAPGAFVLPIAIYQ